MTHTYKTNGVCCKSVHFELTEDKKVHNVTFEGGCNGNTQGIGALVEGMDAEDAVTRMTGITCGPRHTSCPDQLAKALQSALESL